MACVARIVATVLAFVAAVALVIGTIGPPLVGKGVFLTSDLIYSGSRGKRTASRSTSSRRRGGHHRHGRRRLPCPGRLRLAARNGSTSSAGTPGTSAASPSAPRRTWASSTRWRGRSSSPRVVRARHGEARRAGLGAWGSPTCSAGASGPTASRRSWGGVRRVGLHRHVEQLAPGGRGLADPGPVLGDRTVPAEAHGVVRRPDRHRPRVPCSSPMFPAVVGYTVTVLVGYVVIRVARGPSAALGRRRAGAGGGVPADREAAAAEAEAAGAAVARRGRSGGRRWTSAGAVAPSRWPAGQAPVRAVAWKQARVIGDRAGAGCRCAARGGGPVAVRRPSVEQRASTASSPPTPTWA